MTKWIKTTKEVDDCCEYCGKHIPAGKPCYVTKHGTIVCTNKECREETNDDYLDYIDD